MKFFLITISLSLLSSSCIAQANGKYKYTGYEIGYKFTVLQDFITDYEVENGGPVFYSDVSIYKASENQCIMVSRIDGDSGVYGTETILYFYNSKVSFGYYVNYNYIFSNSDDSIKLNKVNYEKPKIKRSLVELNREFGKYINKINQKTLNICSN
ncbi:hypothetical protein [Acinetobacter sp. WZC-1]|uniref:hypothetical protein n=1 Tax=Acinetobacter sp. WZC-1 TaxID=3459034 RepID=UPI00403DB6A4